MAVHSKQCPARLFVMLTVKAPCKPMSWQTLSAHSIQSIAVATTLLLKPGIAAHSNVTTYKLGSIVVHHVRVTLYACVACTHNSKAVICSAYIGDV